VLTTVRPDLIASLLGFGAVVLVPLALDVGVAPSRRGVYPKPLRLAAFMHLPSAVAVFLALAIPDWPYSGWLAVPWLVVTILVALSGLRRMAERGLRFIEGAAVDLGCMFLGVSGAWAVVTAVGATPLDFDRATVSLASVHFMYAGFFLPVFGAMVRRSAPTRLASAALLGVLAGVPLVALGIAFSDTLERAGAVLLGLSAGIIAILQAVRSPGNKLQRLGLTASSLFLLLGMGFALAYALAGGVGTLSQRAMLWLHGVPNAFGFGLIGLLSWSLAVPRPLAPPLGIPFSPERSRWKVGPAHFERAGLEDASRRLEGLTDSFDVFARPNFPSMRVHPDIRDFYERTEQYDLLVSPEWTRGFRLLYRAFRLFARSVGQTDFPLVENRPIAIANRIAALLGDRPGLRAWIRTYAPDGKRAMYVAEYATHELRGVTYMDIAFPYPGGNLASILRPEPIDVGGQYLGFCLTTRDPSGWGDAGIWFANRIAPLRLPLQETIDVWAVGMTGIPAPLDQAPSGTKVVARHELRMFGVRYLVLYYFITPRMTAE
jgi:hypothetical protein